MIQGRPCGSGVYVGEGPFSDLGKPSAGIATALVGLVFQLEWLAH